jgi:hypothetical protein
MVDVHDALLFWKVTGWSAGFSGDVLDYGTWPKQDVSHFSMREAHNTLQRKYSCPKEAAILAGLVELMETLFSRIWTRDDGLELRLDLLLVDGRYLPDTVAQAVRRVNRGQAVMPSFGIPISAKQAAMSQWNPKPGERRGHYWTQGPAPSMPGLQTIKFDANHWKTHLHARYATPLGSQGCLSLFGTAPAQHRLVSEHLASEYPTTTEGRGRRLQEWQLRPGGPDNHFLDTGVGCCVAASVLGITLAGAEPASRRPKQRVKFSDLQRQKWAGLR